MKAPGAALALLGVILTVSPANGSPFDYSGSGVSGYAANALIKAYDSAGFDRKKPPPFVLQPYVVRIDRAPGEFDVDFYGEVTTASWEIVVQQSGGVGTPSPSSTAEPTDGVTLPGVVAGAIIVAYRQALLITGDFGGYFAAKLRTGAYNAAYGAGPGYTYVAFIPLNAPSTKDSTKPAPTPSLENGMKCLAGNCDRRVGYYVFYRDGKVRVREQHLL